MIQTTKEKILEAATKCPQAKETLKVLFPEVFEGSEPFVLHNGKGDFNSGTLVLDSTRDHYVIIMDGRRFFLSSYYNWEIKESGRIFNNTGAELILIPTRKP
jgi:hypothetical protein